MLARVLQYSHDHPRNHPTFNSTNLLLILMDRIQKALHMKLEDCRSALRKKSRRRTPIMFQYALNGDWDLIPGRTRSHPREAQFVYKMDDLSDTALHRIMRPLPMVVEFGKEAQRMMNTMKLKAIVALLKANPDAIAVPDSLGRTPLHLACMDVSNGGTEAVLMMIETTKDGPSACAPDLDGRTPLHYLVARNTFYTPQLLIKLISLWPPAISLKDVVGDTPLDIASRRTGWSRPKEAFEVLVELKHAS